ncbi:hypothetical protein D3C72_2020930 [compost metagenome]
MIDEITDVILHVLSHAGDDAHRLVQRDKHQMFRITWLNPLAVNLHHVPDKYLSGHGGYVAVDENVALFDMTIGTAA